MKFVEAGVSRCDQKSQPPPRSAQGPAKQRGQDRVFGEVPAFADDELDRGDRRVGDARGKPAEKRADEPRGMRGREQIGGADEDENHPGEDGQPGFEERAH